MKLYTKIKTEVVLTGTTTCCEEAERNKGLFRFVQGQFYIVDMGFQKKCPYCGTPVTIEQPNGEILSATDDRKERDVGFRKRNCRC